MPGDTFFNPDSLTAGTLGDVFQNTVGGGDVWFDVISHVPTDIAWDILNANSRDIAWDILNVNGHDIAWDILNVNEHDTVWDILNNLDQGISWSVFAKVLYFIKQFYVNPINFNFQLANAILFDLQILEPLVFEFKPTSTINETINIKPISFSFATNTIMEPVVFNFSILKPTQFNFGISTILHGERDTKNILGG